MNRDTSKKLNHHWRLVYAALTAYLVIMTAVMLWFATHHFHE